MNELNQFLWVIFPYLCIVVFIVGHIFRYKYDQLSWSAKSSEFVEKKQLMIGSAMFHVGIIPVIFGHIGGLFVPKSWTQALGISDHMYHLGAVYIGSLFGWITLLGMMVLTYRRFWNKKVFRLSSISDLVVNVVLLLIICVGLYSTIGTNITDPSFDYRTTISVWLRDLLMFQPDASLMTTVPTAFKVHILLGFCVAALWPFTRLVHIWSVPILYIKRNYILYRRNK